MKKILLVNIFLIIISLGFSYVYLQGENVLNSGDPIFIKGYNEKQVFMKVYNIENDINVIMNREVENQERKVYKTKILNANSEGNIDEKFTVNEIGLYFVEFIKNNEIISSDSFLVSDLNFIAFYDGKNLFLDMRDKNGNQVNSDIYIKTENGKTTILNDKKVLNYEIENISEIYVKSKKGIAFKNFYYYRNNYPNNPIEFLKDKPIYKNDQEVKFNIYSFVRNENYYVLKPNEKMSYFISDPAGNKLVEKEITTNNLGIYTDSYYISESAPFGYYSVTIKTNEEVKNTGFIVENYEKPTYEIEINRDDVYYNKDTIDYEIELNYYDGNPVSNAEIKYYVYYGRYPMNRDRLVYDGKSFTNENGVLNIPIGVDIKEDGYYTLEIISIDQSQKQMEKRDYVEVLKGKYNIEILGKEDFYLKLNNGYRLSLKDREGNTISGFVDLTIKKDVYENEQYNEKIIQKESIEVQNGLGDFSIENLSNGFYTIEFSYKDTIKSFYLNISPNEDQVELSIETNKINSKTYEVNINKPKDMTGYIYLSGLNVYEKKELKKDKNKYEFELPEKILERNVFVEVIGIYQGNVYKSSKAIMTKENINYNFDLSIEKDVYKPGEEVTIKIKSPEKSIYNISVVDDALYDVYEDNYDMKDSLYPELYSSNILLSGREEYFYVRRLSELSTEDSHVFASYKGSRANENVREYFPENALWIPFIEVDGEKEIKFKNPDSLTRWRVNVLGINSEKIEDKKINYTSKKEFYVTPYIPENISLNDTMTLKLSVTNNSTKTKNISYKIYNQEKSVSINKSEGEIQLDPNETKIVSFDLKAIAVGKDNLIFDFEDDIVKLPIDVYANDINQNFVKIIDSDMQEVKVKKGDSWRKFSVENIIKDNIKFLDEYEYRCTEQTVSTLIPLLVADKNGYEIDDIDKKVTSSLQILYKYQRSDGGWGWWMNSEKSNLLMTTYVLEAFHIIQQYGYQVSQQVVNNGLNYLSSNTISGYQNYVLNLYDSAINLPLNKVEKIDLLFMSLYDKDAFELLLEKIEENKDMIAFEFNNYYNTDLELNSYLLLSMIKNGYKDESIIKLMNTIVNLRSGYYWYSTKDTAIALRAILEAKNYLSLSDNESDFHEVTKSSVIRNKGLIEIFSNEKIEENLSNMVINKNFYKKFSTKLYKGHDVYIVDYFIDISKDFNVENIKYISKDTILKKTDHEYIYLKDEDFKYSDNIYYTYKDLTLYVFGEKIENAKEVMIHKDEIYVIDTKNNLFKYESGLLYKNDLNVLSMTYHKGNFTYLFKKDGEKYLKFNQYDIELSDDIFSLDTLNEELYIFGDKTFIFNEEDLTLYERVPMVSKKIKEDKNGEITFYGGLKFSGNNSWTDIEGIYKINYNKEKIKVKSGDILKSEIKIDSNIKNYLTIESYIPSNSQLLENYQERRITDSGKYYNYWYSDWSYSYTSYNFRKNKITFFNDYYNSGDYDYYFKILSTGEYYIKPDFGYNMYLPNSYGINTKTILKVE
ncbi:MAG: alpha-2-macroglobulin [Geotoga sp.]|nr:alpha-2-macroglobulin [Geotoga sp.]